MSGVRAGFCSAPSAQTQGQERLHVRRSRAAIAFSTATSTLSAIAVRWPIFRPGCGLVLAVQVQLRHREWRARRPSRVRRRPTNRRADSPSPPGRICIVDPSGSPHTARTCCSNWLVTHASKVKCPELCGRGAISLTSRRPSVVRKNSTQSTPDVRQLLHDGVRDLHRLTRDRAGRCARARRTRRGCGCDARFRMAPKCANAPSRPRAATTDSSWLKSTTRSTTAS